TCGRSMSTRWGWVSAETLKSTDRSRPMMKRVLSPEGGPVGEPVGEPAVGAALLIGFGTGLPGEPKAACWADAAVAATSMRAAAKSDTQIALDVPRVAIP